MSPAQRLAIFLGRHGVDQVSGEPVAAALRLQLVGDRLVLGNQHEIVREDAGPPFDLAVRQIRLRGMQRQVGQRAVVVVGDGEQPLDGQAVVAADKWIVVRVGHGISPAEDGRGNPLLGIEPSGWMKWQPVSR